MQMETKKIKWPAKTTLLLQTIYFYAFLSLIKGISYREAESLHFLQSNPEY